MAEVIETDRLILRPIDEDDKEFIFSMNENAQMMETLPEIPFTSAELRERNDWLLQSEGKIQGGAWIMLKREDNTPIGSIIFCQMPLSEYGVDPVTYTDHVEIGYRCLPETWGKGYTTEAGKAVISYVFENNILNQVTACTDDDNLASQAVLKKIGLKPAGRTDCYGGNFPFFAISKEDWLAS
ncbi:GNAT family N-acetyltransferase [Curvivirga aplysinae]|uniref:GNAT family N-acetyltransferase n=1 Tax=Curvivirga aplysinae TaxID=2529852 RepID=UPI0012BD80A6|nr:GNAT family N-acetyltransferase [Curvivirga aplysinae]MTI10689.1 N-acetyltransferase [Curvivirga aplysinae]